MTIKRPWRGVLYAAGVLVVFVAILEGLLSTTHLFGARKSWSEPDPVVGWRHSPNRTYWYDGENDHPISGRINRFGWRDRERPLAKPEGTFRVAVMGDSFVEALQVELDSTFVALAENELRRRRGRRVELMNFGRSGMTQAEEFLILKRDVVRFSPDLVVLFFVPLNDVDEIDPATADTALRPFFAISPGGGLALDTSFARSREFRLKRMINPLKQASALVSLLAERYNLLVQSRRRARRVAHSKRIEGALSLCTAHPDAAYVESYRLNKALIEAMAAYCEKMNIRFMLVCGDWIYRREDVSRYTAVDPTFDPDYFDRDLRRFAESLGVEYLGLQEPFRRTYEEKGVALHWHHWNYAGHRVVAEALSEKLESL